MNEVNLQTWEAEAFTHLSEPDSLLKLFSKRIVTLIERVRISERGLVQAQNSSISLARQNLQLKAELEKLQTFLNAGWVEESKTPEKET